MHVRDTPGVAFLLFTLCVCIAGLGYLLLAFVYAYAFLAAVIITALSQGVGNG